jgi:capsular polysaccharide export protein
MLDSAACQRGIQAWLFDGNMFLSREGNRQSMESIVKHLVEAALSPYRIAAGLARWHFRKPDLPPLFLFGFNDWKTFMRDWFPDRAVIFVPMPTSAMEFEHIWKPRILSDRRSEVLAWQYKAPAKLKQTCRQAGVPFQHVEDGFIRSISLGALRVPPMSLAFDRQDMYFNANAPTDLEDLLATYDFDADAGLMERARSAISRLLDTGISKYNCGDPGNIERLYGRKDRRRILVVGQVERDASIRYGCDSRIRNNDLVRLARKENPDAQIIYKPHPEVLLGTAKAESNPDAVRDIALVLDTNISLAAAFATVDHVYTITSLSGFEALLRGIKVTTLGCPFYAGWGLTDERQPNARRTRVLTIEQVFAAAYILYPRYFDPVAKHDIEFEDALEILAAQL